MIKKIQNTKGCICAHVTFDICINDHLKCNPKTFTKKQGINFINKIRPHFLCCHSHLMFALKVGKFHTEEYFADHQKGTTLQNLHKAECREFENLLFLISLLKPCVVQSCAQL